MAAQHSCFSLLLLCFTGERRSKGWGCRRGERGRQRERLGVGEVWRVATEKKRLECMRVKGKEEQLRKDEMEEQKR